MTRDRSLRTDRRGPRCVQRVRRGVRRGVVATIVTASSEEFDRDGVGIAGTRVPAPARDGRGR